MTDLEQLKEEMDKAERRMDIAEERMNSAYGAWQAAPADQKDRKEQIYLTAFQAFTDAQAIYRKKMEAYDLAHIASLSLQPGMLSS